MAREYGIPAVVGVPDATRRIQGGQRVRVDGDTGVVEALTDGEGAAQGDESCGLVYDPAIGSDGG